MNIHSKASIIEKCYDVLVQAGGAYLAIHEVGNVLRNKGIYANDNNIATQLYYLTRDGRAISRYRDGVKFKEWKVLPPNTASQGILPLEDPKEAK